MNRLAWFGGSRLLLVVVAVLLLVPATAAAGNGNDGPVRSVVSVESVGEVRLALDTEFDGTLVGGLSSITYDRWRDTYYALSDDQADFGPVRYYEIDIDLSDGYLDYGDIEFVDVVELFESGRDSFEPKTVDPEGLAIRSPGQLWVSSEGIVGDSPIDPFLRRYNPTGKVTGELPVDDKYLPDGGTNGVRGNLGFESLNFTPDKRYLVTANEGALVQDGPTAGESNGSLARIVIYDLAKREAVAEYVYEVAPLAEPAAGFGVNGIVEVLPTDNHGTMLVMERSFSLGGSLGGGTGNNVKIFEISTEGATNVLGVDALYDGGAPIAYTPVSKREVFDFEAATDTVYNIEGMTFGPPLPDGRHSLVIVSDDNFALFSPDPTQFFVLAVDIERS